MAAAPSDITRWIRRSRAGDAAASAELIALLYDDLKAMARRVLRREPEGRSLEATALVHEAWARLEAAEELEPRDRQHYFALAAQTMRRVLVDHARARRREKRGGGERGVPLAESIPVGSAHVDVIVVNELLDQLEALHPRQARVTELRVFGGMSLPEVAHTLDVSLRTVEADWRMAKSWLKRALDRHETPPERQ